MKHTLHTIAVITFLFSAYFTHAAQEGSYIYTVSNGQATISSFIRSYSGALSITNTLGGCPVTTIGDAAFFSCASLTSVTIPSSVTKVGDFAFYYCTSLTNVTIPASVTTIGTQVFDFCSSLTTIAVDPANVAFSSVDGVLYNKLQTTLIQCPGGKSGNFAIPSTVTTIGDHAFLFCTRLTSVTIPSSVTTIDDNAFIYCTNLTSVTISSSVTTVGDFAFYDCTSLTNVTIPASVTTIGEGAYAYCSSLTTIAVDPTNVAFSSLDGVLYNKLQTTLIQCPGGKSGNFAIPSTVTTIGDHAFLFCARLTSVTIPSSVTTIGDYVFHLCTSLTNVTISSGVTTIGDWAFDRCTSLTNVTIPSSVTTIGERALAACTSLTTIAVDPANVAFSSLDGVLYNKLQTTLIQCPGGKSGNFAIPSTVTTIGNYAFYYCTSLTSVAIPASVTSIGTMAFRDCTSLQRLYFMGALPTYGSDVFYSAPAILYYLPAYATTWPSTIDDRPTKLWNPAFSEATLLSGSISCTVTGSPPIPIAIEAATNLLSAPWLRLQTTNLTSDFLSFDDPDATNYPIRFYRIVGP